MRLPLATLLTACACAVAGCRSNSQQVERELRKREIEVRELRESLAQTEAYNRALLLDVRGQACGPVTPDGPGPAFPVRSLTLGRQTGGRELDQSAGDGALQVVLEPRDAEGQSIKLPNASAIVQAVEIQPDGLKRTLSVWEIPAEQLRNHWRSGLLTTGYVLVLPWKEPPTTEKMRVVALLRTPDGRAFEADKDITIRIPKGMKPKIMPPPVDGPVLPAPRVFDSTAPETTGDRGGSSAVLVARKGWWNLGRPKPSDPPATVGKPVPAP